VNAYGSLRAGNAIGAEFLRGYAMSAILTKQLSNILSLDAKAERTIPTILPHPAGNATVGVPMRTLGI
jgi:hypothetical protein